MATHDLIFFEKRSTPKVVFSGEAFTAPESYGKQTKRRKATEEEEKVIARGDWLRVDEKGKKGGQPGYKKTRMAGREHLVSHSEDSEFEEALAHYGVKGMKWGVRRKDTSSSGGGSESGSKHKESDSDALKDATDALYAKKDSASLQADGQKKLNAQVKDEGFPTKAAAKAEKRGQKADQIEKAAAELDKAAQEARAAGEAIDPGKNLWKRYEKRIYEDQVSINEKARDDLLKKADQVRAGKLTSNQKKMIIAGGLAAAGVTALYVAEQRRMSASGVTHADKRKHIDDAIPTHKREWDSIFGADSAPNMSYALSAGGAEGKGFYAGLTSKKIWDRPEFTIPEGTVFQRLSNHIEDSADYGKVKGAYATFLTNDKKLYGSGSEFGGKSYTVNFTAKGGTKVPSHQTVLSHLKQVMAKEHPGTEIQPQSVAIRYQTMAGGSWSDSTSKRLFESLRQFDYGAIVDDMDAGYLGDLPVVFFGDANPATSTQRTDRDRILDSFGRLKVSGKYS